ncbi:RidA family protein [Clostridium botulinum]|uniref:Endoribonuclease L-PSP n=1 Tax=Clostridium botulinum (strain Eklund 17B / Type B) TaxID=935198 RepID=B2TKS5_CLOBB|nr:RidA family protein [Clostridium sp. VAP51]ACD22379.1 endoribonuclease L-PSP [Clostridium botulinum B str. Eklund 17B (NRP)]MBY6976549.1 RidA family protein [Clostridium botulinum]MBY7001518.1 RidA family protein [Clostridium botulinum]MCR1274355.1 RidA family protein [Clostridium botulinum]NFD69033.1 RidA family protein [Clostridium botulinum]
MLKVTNADKAPKAIGPYSQAISFGDLLFASGQIPLDPLSGEIVGEDIEEQATQVIKNIGAILESNDINFSNVIKTTCFLANMNDFSKFNEVYAKYFISNPARSCVAVKELPKSVLCEVEVIAAK